MEPEENPRERVKHSKINLSGALLVIGIIFVVLIAVVLIIVIVLRMRTSSDPTVKVPDTKSFPPGEVSTSAVAPVNGVAAKPVKTNNNKPVKEWYV